MADTFSETILSAVSSVKRVPREAVSLDSPLETLGFDSLDTTVLLFELEKQFGISIPDEAVRNVRSVRDVVNGVAALIEARTAAAEAPRVNP